MLEASQGLLVKRFREPFTHELTPSLPGFFLTEIVLDDDGRIATPLFGANQFDPVSECGDNVVVGPIPEPTTVLRRRRLLKNLEVDTLCKGLEPAGG